MHDAILFITADVIPFLSPMQKRTLAALVLMMAVIFAYYAFFMPKRQIERVQPRKVEEQSEEVRKVEEIEPPREIAKETEEVRGEELIDFRTDLYFGKLSTADASLRSFRLLKYHRLSKGAEKEPLELVRKYKLGVKGPLHIMLGENQFKSRIWKVKDTVVNEIGMSICFENQCENGLKVEKCITFKNESYIIEVVVRMLGNDEESRHKEVSIVWGPGFGQKEKKKTRMRYYLGPVAMVNGEIKKEKKVTPLKSVRFEGDVDWAALQNQYFIAALIPQGKAIDAKISGGAEGLEDAYVSVGLESVQDKDGISIARATVYLGPKEYERIKNLGVNLQLLIFSGWKWFFWANYWFPKLCSLLLVILNYIYDNVIRNYGVAIIIITLMQKAVLYPLTYKSYKSMKKMQLLQPKLKELTEKYKNDPRKKQQEQMKLYRKEGVNPMGGCFPMLLQMPILIAFYITIARAVELRGAPFVLWIKDLSDKDPYYVLPIVMGVSMLLQQKMSPSSADPAQAKMMYLMPVFFTFLFLNFPAGLVLYWLVNNLLSIGQQAMIKR